MTKHTQCLYFYIPIPFTCFTYKCVSVYIRAHGVMELLRICETLQFTRLPECHGIHHPHLMCPYIQYSLPSFFRPPVPTLSPGLISYPLTPLSVCPYNLYPPPCCYLCHTEPVEPNADSVPPCIIVCVCTCVCVRARVCACVCVT